MKVLGSISICVIKLLRTRVVPRDLVPLVGWGFFVLKRRRVGQNLIFDLTCFLLVSIMYE